MYCCRLWARCQSDKWYAFWWIWLPPFLLLFLSRIAFTHLVNYLVMVKTQMYLFKGEWIGLMRWSPQLWHTLETYVLKAYKICVYEFGLLPNLVMSNQWDPIVKSCWWDFFLPSYSLYYSKITSKNEGPPICYIEGKIWFPFVEDLLCHKQWLHSLLTWLLILRQW